MEINVQVVKWTHSYVYLIIIIKWLTVINVKCLCGNVTYYYKYDYTLHYVIVGWLPMYLPLRRMVTGPEQAWELLLVTWGWEFLSLWLWPPVDVELGSVAAPWTELGLLAVFWMSKNFNSLISMTLEDKHITDFTRTFKIVILYWICYFLHVSYTFFLIFKLNMFLYIDMFRFIFRQHERCKTISFDFLFQWNKAWHLNTWRIISHWEWLHIIKSP